MIKNIEFVKLWQYNIIIKERGTNVPIGYKKMKREYTVNLALAYAKRFLKKYGRGSETLDGMCNHVKYLYYIRDDEIEDFKKSLLKWNDKQPISYFI